MLKGPVVVVLLMAAGVAVALYRVTRTRPLRLRAAIAPLILAVLAADVYAQVYISPFFSWNDARLAPTFFLRYGYKLYYPATSGPVLNTIYPPVYALLYLPATIATHPEGAIRFGVLLTILIYLLPAALVARRGSKETLVPGDRDITLVGFGAFWLLSQLALSLRYASTSIHADAASVGLVGLGGCLLLHAADCRYAPPGRSVSLKWLLAACVAFGGAVWSKQTIAPALVIVPIWMLLARGWWESIRASLLLGAVCCVPFGLLWLTSSLSEFVFNTLTLPSKHPWNGSFPVNILSSFLDLQRSTLAYLILPVWAAVSVWRVHRRGLKPFACEQQGWLLFAIMGLLCVPTGVLGYVKVGGYYNNFAPCHYLLLLSNLAILVSSYRCLGPLTLSSVQRTALACLLLLPAAIVAQQSGASSLASRGVPATTVAYDHILAHPDTDYFPDHPLSHLLADGKGRHLDYGLFDRELGGFPVEGPHLAEGLPSELEVMWIAAESERTKCDVLFSNFTADDDPEVELPGFRPLRPIPGLLSPSRE